MSDIKAVESTEVHVPNNEYEMRQMLNSLSKLVYGTSSKWKKLVDNGFPVKSTEEGSNVTYKVQRPSLAEVYQHMVSIKANSDAQFKAYQDKLNEEHARKQLENSLSGSAAL